MRTNRLFSIAVVACLAGAGAVSAGFDVVDRARIVVSSAITGWLIDGLKLFATPKLVLHKLPTPRPGLTSRQRHDLGQRRAKRLVTQPQWSLIPST
ncbi:hypothetical protein E8K88_02475 [Lampropedia aestuarii]|uniref:Uncharacterized protein n=1 Tax=Lampropedia aestuarii TaxID=2562762 RepID=A0A4S5BTZ2_9BURK|nr:hypothetical protein [Lampropedia aestuarii]MDH5855686.1 hypothetical protein [Lampropedia aestuarii]THJ36150.1 hypothetical protein E8K88_02475 [Lampropedia aestuarii]